MNAIQFIKEHGVEKARGVVSGAPECSSSFNIVSGSIVYYQLCDNWWWFNSAKKEYEMDYSKSMKFDLSDLKRIVESVDLIRKVGGVDCAKYCVSINKLNDHFYLRQAIADYESIYGGEHV